MSTGAIAAEVQDSIKETGVLEPGLRVLVMLSGGADSVCLLHALFELIGPSALIALHVNHGLRPAAADDERFCAELSESLGVPLEVERVQLATRGNVEALAREARYGVAEKLRRAAGLDRIATGHTASDQVETVLYRLVSSPGRRALLGMQPRNGAVIRPLLRVTREQARAYCRAAGLAWREDETNLDRRLARNRLRLDVLPALREIHPAADENLLSTIEELTEESEVLERAVDEAIERVGAGGQPPAVEAARLRELAPALRRLVLRRLAEAAAAGPLPLRTGRVEEIEALAARGGTAALDLGGGVRVVSEYGLLRFRSDVDGPEPEPVRMAVPGRCQFGSWQVACELESTDSRSRRVATPDEALVDAGRLAAELTVRSWRAGDRMRPLGLGGTKSLQDLFTDRKVPRGLRRTLPVVESDGEIVWVAGVAVSERFALTGNGRAGNGRAVRLRASST
jgi:tRNA(Ile)-lysidine synthase